MTYEAQHGLHVGRPPCLCGAAYRLHLDGACPVRYRPDTLAAAVREFQGASTTADTFAARGEIQRLLGRGHDPDGCAGCEALR